MINTILKYGDNKMITINESENYIQIYEDNATNDTKHILNNIHPNSEHMECDYMLLDYEIKAFDSENNKTITERYNPTTFEDSAGEEEYNLTIKKIGEFIKNNIMYTDKITVKILLKKSLENPINL